MRIVLLGFPGSGKGTQAKLMAEKYRVPQISTGDILRAAVADKTEIGKKVAAVMVAGELVSDDIVIDAVTDRLRSAESRRGFVLDGFPRSIPQAQELDTRLGWMSRSLQLALHFSLDNNVVVKLIYGNKIPENILGDAFRFQQIIVNLLDNARKYAPGGVTRVQVFRYTKYE